MALQFTVWNTAAEVANGPVLNENVVAIGGTSTQSGLIDPTGGNRGRRVRIAGDADCWVNGGENPTAAADTGGRMMGPTVSSVEYFDILANFKIAVDRKS